MTCARLEVFMRDKIVAHSEHDVPARKSAKRGYKQDGKRPKTRAVQKTIRKGRLNPEWRGEGAPGGLGRKPSIRTKFEQAADINPFILQPSGMLCWRLSDLPW